MDGILNPVLAVTGMRVETIVVFGAALAAFLALISVSLPLLERGQNQRRVNGIVERRDALRRAATAPVSRPTLAGQGTDVAKRITRRLRLLRGKPAEIAGRKLLRAGYRGKDAVAVFLFLKFALPGVLGLSAALLLFGVDPAGIAEQAKLPIALAAVLTGFYAPDIFVKNQADKRREKLRRALPDALDLLVICAEAGLTLDGALVRVSREIEPGGPELSDELEFTSVELGFLPERRLALENLERRIGLPGVRALVGTLAQAERYGTPLAQSLRVLAAEMRDERLMKAEEKAARLPATLTVPMVLFIMPALFIVLIGPGILRVLDSLRAL